MHIVLSYPINKEIKMADYSNFYNTGQLKWAGKTNQLASGSTSTDDQSGSGNTPQPPSNIITGLLSTDIKTSVQGQSIKITQNSITVAMFMLSEIASWDLNANQITIYSTDLLPLILVFASINEAELGDQRLTDATNGGLLT